MLVIKNIESLRCINNDLRNNFSIYATRALFNNCYESGSLLDDHFFMSKCTKCKNKVDKVTCVNLSKYRDTPFLHPIIFEENIKEEKIEVFIEGTSNTSSHGEEIHTLEDILARNNCNAMVINQRVWRPKSKKMGAVARLLLSPVAIDANGASDIFEYYNKDKEWPVIVWSPSFEELFELMDNENSEIFIAMMNDLQKDLYNIDPDPVNLVENYLEHKLNLNRNDNWDIKDFHKNLRYYGEGNIKSEDYYYNIDCRILFSLIKQIMIIENELYPIIYDSNCEDAKMVVKGKHKIIEDFILYCKDKNLYFENKENYNLR